MGDAHNGDGGSVARLSVPIAWAVALVVTIGGGFYWAATMQQSIDALKADHARVNGVADALRDITARVNNLDKITAQIEINTGRLTRIETQIDAIRADIERMEAHIMAEQRSPYPPGASP